MMSESHDKKPVYWVGNVGEKDDFGNPITDTIIDGVTTYGSWALMTPECHSEYGRGLGIGRGQKYVKQADGKWLRVEG
jgi:hypothetical protein